MDLFNYLRRETNEVYVGAVKIGAENGVVTQSMTNTNTLDTENSVEQIKRIVDAGADIVRLTTQGVKEAENLRDINISLRSQGYMTPLVADVHFTANVADVAALYAEKVRINPGNYVDSAKRFEHIDYTDEEYIEELLKIKKRFIPFLNICKENNTAIRLGVNHGSLSDRIMSRYGDTPEGMVESCMEFLRICVEENFYNVVISIKASNTVVMVRTVRLLCQVMEKEGMRFPLHLGVTEAGEGEDGRIKSALGIGSLLSDGIGDTIRVSLSEKPEAEIPVAKKIVEYSVNNKAESMYIPAKEYDKFNYTYPLKRRTKAIKNIGGDNLPIVVSARLNNEVDINKQFIPEYIYVGQNLPDRLIDGMKYIVDADCWNGDNNTYPAFSYNQLHLISLCPSDLKFLFLTYMAYNEEVSACLKSFDNIVVVSQTNHQNRLGEHRALIHQMMNEDLKNPVVIFQHYNEDELEDLQIKSSIDMGSLIFDGFCDGIFLYNQGSLKIEDVDSTAFSILQAGRIRTSKTEYISCPGCGRTLFDLETTVAKVKKATSHLTGVKIAVMGCIVNGPGEMADADYGYVGAGRGRISLYKGKECIEKNIPESEAVEKLLNLINTDMSEC